jgi:hypothetical protein
MTIASFLPDHFGSANGVALGDRIAGKLGDALYLLDEVLEMTAAEGCVRLDVITRQPVQRAYAEIDAVMKQITD